MESLPSMVVIKKNEKFNRNGVLVKLVPDAKAPYYVITAAHGIFYNKQLRESEKLTTHANFSSLNLFVSTLFARIR